jgi:predicted metal-dependent HD superfamily phosphohydrolase
MLLANQWKASWEGLGISITPMLIQEFKELIARYSEPHRRYHTVRHLEECFAKLTEIHNLAEHAAEVELALWFHDAIYEKHSSQNEVKSAELAVKKVLAAGGSVDAAARISNLIMATRHAVLPRNKDEQVLIDVDLSILGAEPERFEEYERQIREEYSWVPWFLFREKRRKILKDFLARPTIFNTHVFIQRYEKQARQNIERSITRLGS